jgi:hypothetical protein
MAKDATERPLADAFAVAEGVFAERWATIENLARKTGAKPTYAAVLRWLVDHGAVERSDVEAHAGRIGGSYWVDVSERTVYRALAFWKSIGVLILRNRVDDNGTKLPPHAKVDWGSVLGILGVQRSGSVPSLPSADDWGGRPSVAGPPGDTELSDQSTAAGARDERQFSPPSTSGCPGDRSADPTDNRAHSDGCPGDNGRTPTDTGSRVRPSPGGPGDKPNLLHGAWPSVERVLACARTVCSDSDSVTVDDVVSSGVRKADWCHIERLAAEGARIIYGRGGLSAASPEAQKALLASALLALTVFNPEWFLRSARLMGPAVARGVVNCPHRYLITVLRSNCFQVGCVGNAAGDISPDWFGAVMFCAERAVNLYGPVLAKPAAPEPVEEVAPETQEQRSALAAQLREDKEALKARCARESHVARATALAEPVAPGADSPLATRHSPLSPAARPP